MEIQESGDDVGCPTLLLACGPWCHSQSSVCILSAGYADAPFLGGGIRFLRGVRNPSTSTCPPSPTVPLTWGPLCLPPPSPAPPGPHHSRRIQGPPVPPSPGYQSPHGGSTPGWKPPDPLLQTPKNGNQEESQWEWRGPGFWGPSGLGGLWDQDEGVPTFGALPSSALQSWGLSPPRKQWAAVSTQRPPRRVPAQRCCTPVWESNGEGDARTRVCIGIPCPHWVLPSPTDSSTPNDPS